MTYGHSFRSRSSNAADGTFGHLIRDRCPCGTSAARAILSSGTRRQGGGEPRRQDLGSGGLRIANPASVKLGSARTGTPSPPTDGCRIFHRAVPAALGSDGFPTTLCRTSIEDYTRSSEYDPHTGSGMTAHRGT